MRKIAICSFLLLTLPLAARVIAQDAPKASDVSKAPDTATAPEQPVHYYHLDLVVRELDDSGKPVNSRAYSCTVSTFRHESESIRVRSTIPTGTGSDTHSHIQLGVNFDLHEVHEVGSNLAMDFDASIDGSGANPQVDGQTIPASPVIRWNSWHTTALIPIGKPTVVITSDDLDGKGSMQVMLTATLLQ